MENRIEPFPQCAISQKPQSLSHISWPGPHKSPPTDMTNPAAQPPAMKDPYHPSLNTMQYAIRDRAFSPRLTFLHNG